MAGDNKQLLIRIRADLKQAQDALRQVGRELGKLGGEGKQAADGIDQAGRAQDRAAGASDRLAAAARRVAVAYGTWKLAEFIKNVTVYAGQMEELGVVLEVVGRNTGHTGTEMHSLVAQVKELHLSTRAASTAVIRLAQNELDLSKAVELARLAQNAAVIGQVDSSEALQRIIHGIVTAQPEVLRTIGLSLTFEQEYAKMARTLGKNAAELTEAEKAQIRLNSVLEQGAAVAGAYVAAMEKPSKQLRSLTTDAADAAEQLGLLFQKPFRASISLTRDLLREATEALRGWNAAAGRVDYSKLSPEAIDAEVEKLQKRLGEIEQEVEGRSLGEKIFDALVPFNLPRRLLEAQGIAKQIDALLAARPAAVARQEEPLPPPRDTGADELLKARAEELAAALQKRLALLNANTEAAVRYEIEHGKLIGLDKEHADKLLALARAEDAAGEAEKRRSEQARNAEADEKLIAGLERQVELLGESARAQAQAAAAARLSADATDEQIAQARELAGALFDARDAGEDAFADLKAAVKGWGADFEDTLADMVVSGQVSFRALANAIIRDLIRIAAHYAVVQPLLQGFGIVPAPKAAGGPVQARAHGGMVSGPGGPTDDRVPILASDGEYVVRAAAVDRYGKGFLDQLNALRLPRFPNAPPAPAAPAPAAPRARYATGGLVRGAAPQAFKVEVENKGSQPVRVADARARIDPEGAVVHIVLDDLEREGPITRSLQGTFGLRRGV